jgi:hypothetical protein
MFPQFTALGFEHILGGYDHLLFLSALVIVSRKWKDLLGVISAFSIAHTATIVLSVYGFLALPSILTECAIALSIAYAGISNVIGRQVDRKWIMAGAFGLLHGAGLSAPLLLLLKPLVGTVTVPIFGFTTGIELGQIAVVALVYPMVMLARSYGRERVLVRAASVAIAIAGVTLFVLRLAGSSI